jgi:hypothetical protein
MSRQLALTFALVALFGSNLFGQTDPNIFNVQSRERHGATTGRVLTGFRIAGLKGIVTAFHGVVGAAFISATSGSKTYAGLSIQTADIARDIALLTSKEIESEPTAPGFMIAEVPPEYSEVFVNGYPLGLIYPLETKGSLRKPSLTLLRQLIPPGPALTEFEARRSPAVDRNVVSVQADIQPGLSGAPVFFHGQVVGIVNGGLLSGQSGIIWASVAKDIQWGAAGPPPVGAPPGYLLSGLADLPPDLPVASSKREEIANSNVSDPALEGGTVASDLSIDEKGHAELRTKLEGKLCVTSVAALLDDVQNVLWFFGSPICAEGSATKVTTSEIPRELLGRLRNVALVHRLGRRPPESVIYGDMILPPEVLAGGQRVPLVPQKVMIAQDRAVSADGCSEQSQWFTASAPGELDLTRGGEGGAPAGFDFDVRGNNDREVRHASRDGQSISFEAWTRGKGSGVPGLCIGAEGSNISVDVYAWIKTAKE